MKNLKQVLALGMAFSLTMSTMASAAFTDQADIKATEAVNVLNALGVIKGYEDGSFKPEGVVTRAEAAKMIFTIRNGGSDDASSWASTPTSFTDLNGYGWAEGYIKFCQTMGIIAGKSATKFDPGAPVTGTELAKMMLVTLGYQADKAGLVGSTWANKTLALATENGLLEDVKADLSAGLPRQYAAQVMYNAVMASTVRWSTDGNAYTNKGTDNTPNESLGSKYMGLEQAVGIYNGNYYNETGVDKGEIKVNITANTDKNAAGTPVTGVQYGTYDLGLDWVGEEVKVLYKNSVYGSAGLDDKDTVYGIFNTGSTKVYTTTKGKIGNASATDITNGEIVIDGKNYKVANGITGTDVVVDINNGSTTVNATTAGATTASGFATYLNNALNGLRVGSNDKIKFVCNNSGEIVKAYVTTSQYGKITSLTSDKIAIEGLGTKKLEDCSVYEGAAVGDLVKVTEQYTTTKRMNVVEKASTVTGKITAYKADSNQVQIDGTWYKEGVNKAVATDYTSVSTTSLAAGNVNDQVELIVDGDYYFAYKKISGFNDYAVVIKGSTEFSNTRVKLLKADGTEVVTTADTLEGSTTLPATINAADGELMAFSLKSDDSKVDLDETDVVNKASASFTDKNNTLTVSGTGYVVANDAAVFLYNAGDNKWKVYTANQLSDIASMTNVQYIVKNSQIVAIAADVASFPTAGSSSVAYGYVTERVDRTTANNGDKTVRLTVWDGSNSVTLDVDTGCTAYAGDFIEFPIVADGAIIDDGDIKVDDNGSDLNNATMGAATVKVKSVEDGRIITTTDAVSSSGAVVAGTDTAYVVTDNTKYIGVDSANKASSDNNSVVAYTKAYGDDFANAYIIYEKKTGYNEIKAIFIDASNKLVPAVNGASGSAMGAAVSITATSGTGNVGAIAAGNWGSETTLVINGDATNNKVTNDTSITVPAGKNLVINATTFDAGSGKTFEVNGTAYINANVTGSIAITGTGTVVINGTVATLANSTSANVTIDKDVTTVTDITSGTVTFNGKVGTVTNVTNGTATFGGDVTTVTNITAGTVTFNGKVGTVTDVTAGTVAFNGEITTLTQVSGGTVVVNAEVKNELTAATTAAFKVGAKGKVTLNYSGSGNTNITGEAGATAVVVGTNVKSESSGSTWDGVGDDSAIAAGTYKFVGDSTNKWVKQA